MTLIKRNIIGVFGVMQYVYAVLSSKHIFHIPYTIVAPISALPF